MATRSNQADFEEIAINIRGTDYVLRELTAGEYAECLALTTNAETGDVDMVNMVSLMLTYSIKKPALSDQQLASLPYKTSRALKREVSRLHWADEQEETAEDAEKAIEEEGAGPNP